MSNLYSSYNDILEVDDLGLVHTSPSYRRVSTGRWKQSLYNLWYIVIGETEIRINNRDPESSSGPNMSDQLLNRLHLVL